MSSIASGNESILHFIKVFACHKRLMVILVDSPGLSWHPCLALAFICCTLPCSNASVTCVDILHDKSVDTSCCPIMVTSGIRPVLIKALVLIWCNDPKAVKSRGDHGKTGACCKPMENELNYRSCFRIHNIPVVLPVNCIAID